MYDACNRCGDQRADRETIVPGILLCVYCHRNWTDNAPKSEALIESEYARYARDAAVASGTLNRGHIINVLNTERDLMHAFLKWVDDYDKTTA